MDRPRVGGLNLVPVGQSAQQVAQQVAGMTTSSRLWTMPSVQAGDTLVATTTSEQFYASGYVIPANSLTVGQSLTFKGSGIYTTTALLPPTQRARLRLGGQTMVDSGALSFPVSLSALRYWFEIQMVVRAVGASGAIESVGRLDFATSLSAALTVVGGPNGLASESGNPVTVDTTQPLPVQLSCTFGAVLAGNQNVLRQASLHSLRPAA